MLNGTGQGGGGVVSVSAGWIDFLPQAVGSTSIAQTLTLSNTGVAALNNISIEAIGDFARSTTCGATLARGADCSISVQFAPTSHGWRTGTLVIHSDAVGSPSSIVLTGEGISEPMVSLDKTALGFVLNNTGVRLVQTFSLTNTGTMLLNLGSITASEGFFVDHNCGGGLRIGGNCTVTVTFVSGGTANARGSILITSDAPGSPHKVALTAMGASAAADTVFNSAERIYPDFFAPANGPSQSVNGYRSRLYSGGGYLAVNDASEPHLLYKGPLSGGEMRDLGELSIWLAQTVDADFFQPSFQSISLDYSSLLAKDSTTIVTVTPNSGATLPNNCQAYLAGYDFALLTSYIVWTDPAVRNQFVLSPNAKKDIVGENSAISIDCGSSPAMKAQFVIEVPLAITQEISTDGNFDLTLKFKFYKPSSIEGTPSARAFVVAIVPKNDLFKIPFDSYYFLTKVTETTWKWAFLEGNDIDKLAFNHYSPLMRSTDVVVPTGEAVKDLNLLQAQIFFYYQIGDGEFWRLGKIFPN
jgi:hypothetical protein